MMEPSCVLDLKPTMSSFAPVLLIFDVRSQAHAFTERDRLNAAERTGDTDPHGANSSGGARRVGPQVIVR